MAICWRRRRLGSLTMAANPEEGHLRAIGIGEDQCPAFTE